MKNESRLVEQLQQAIGGEWEATPADAPVKGYTANFPKFRSDAIVGVINDVAGRAGIGGQAVSFSSGAGSDILGSAPTAPRDVVIPREMAENRRFQEQLDEGIRETIMNVVSQQLSYAASTQWMQRC